MEALRTLILNPEALALLLAAGAFARCAWQRWRHGRSGPCVAWIVPLALVLVLLSPNFLLETRNWPWLLRTNLALLLSLSLCAWRLIPARGSSTPTGGQDRFFLLILAAALVLAAPANAFNTATILAQTSPEMAHWLEFRRAETVLLALLAAVPFGFALSVLSGLGLGLVALLAAARQR